MTARKPSKGKPTAEPLPYSCCTNLDGSPSPCNHGRKAKRPTPAEMAERIYRRLGQIHPLDICFCGLAECCGDRAARRAILEVLSDGAPRGKA